MQTQVQSTTLPISPNIAVALFATAPTPNRKQNHGPTEKRNRYLNLRRPVCGEAENAAREGRAERGRTGGKERHSENNSLRLGIKQKNCGNRQIATSSRVCWGYNSHFDAAQIIRKNFPQKRITPIVISAEADYIIFRNARRAEAPQPDITGRPAPCCLSVTSWQ